MPYDMKNTICIDDDGSIYFCGDDLYGHYTREEFLSLCLELFQRIFEVLEEVK